MKGKSRHSQMQSPKDALPLGDLSALKEWLDEVLRAKRQEAGVGKKKERDKQKYG